MSSIDKAWVENHIDSNGEVIIPEGIEKIEAEAFKDNKLVRKVVMPNTLTEIGDNAFSGCTNLEDIEFSENLKTIGENAFLGSKINLNSKETAHELVEKYKNSDKTKDLHEEVVQWCSKNIENMDLSNKDHSFLYGIATTYLMKTNQILNWSERDATVLIHYMSKNLVKKLKLDDVTKIKILTDEEYRNLNGNDSNAVCIDNGNNTYDIEYSPVVMKNLLSGNTEGILKGFQTMCHEIIHVLQGKFMRTTETRNPEIYLMAMETLARRNNPDMYKANWGSMLKENHAEKLGLEIAFDNIIKIYSPELYNLYNKDEIKERKDKYDKNYYEGKIELFGEKRSCTAQIDKACCMYLLRNPKVLEQFPILQIGFNMDGTKKNLLQLLDERQSMIDEGNPIDKVNGLYSVIANCKNFVQGTLYGTKEELYTLHDYIEKTGTKDEFIYNLIKYRLEHNAKMSPEQIAEFMELEYSIAEKTRQEREEQEIKCEESESIKDEIGDEFKPKTEQQEQEERQVESMWQNRFQSWDRDTAVLPDGAKKKAEAVQVMQDLQRQQDKDKEKQNQEQLDNQNNDQR